MSIRRAPKIIYKAVAMMAELELKISEFQGERGDRRRQERDFWSSLKKDEVAHEQCL